ncbi:MAG: dihydrolipoamide acetyltransferase family protein [Pseudomonadota bacterium]
MIDVIVPPEQTGSACRVVRLLADRGDKIAADEVICEVETDKLVFEVSSPASGWIAELLVNEGDAADPGAVIARVSSDRPTHEGDALRSEPRCAPSVRRAVEQAGLDLNTITGTGKNGRVTLVDVERAQGETGVPSELPARVVPHSPRRLAMSRNMTEALRTAPHVTALVEADFTAVATHLSDHRNSFAERGVKLTYTSYIVAAVARAMEQVPEVNSRWTAHALEVFEDVNVGVAVDLDGSGVMVPVLHRVTNLSFETIAERVDALTGRADGGSFDAQECVNATFTISNHGALGTLTASPIIIHGGLSAILGIGKVEKRAVVRSTPGREDRIEIRPMSYVTLTIDHRALDASHANAWLSAFVDALEGADW